MTNEEMQRTMEFIVEQQAHFAANIQRLEEQRVRDEPRLARLEESFQRLVALCEITDARLDRLESTTSELESTTSELESTTSELESTTSALAASMTRLAETQADTDKRLSALIDIVREDRNGEHKRHK